MRRVPMAKASTRRRPATAACMNRSSAREYGSIDPLTSHSRTSRRGCRDGAYQARRMGSPPVRNAPRTVARMSGCVAAAASRAAAACCAASPRWREDRPSTAARRRSRPRCTRQSPCGAEPRPGCTKDAVARSAAPPQRVVVGSGRVDTDPLLDGHRGGRGISRGGARTTRIHDRRRRCPRAA